MEMIESGSENDMDEENEERNESTELTSLMPMQHVNEDMILMTEDKDLGSTSQTTPGLAEDEVIPTEYIHFMECDDGMEVFPQSDFEETKLVQKDTEEEIIQKLLQEKISYSEVAKLLGDDCEDFDQEEDDPPVEENHAVEFEKELNQQQRYHLKRRRVGEKRRRRRLPDAALLGLMGEANLRYARREYDVAIKMCMEIIRQYPNSSEPYETLGLIYEAKNMMNKSLQFLFIAAFLSPDGVLWEKLAELSLKEGDVSQAIFCWGRAIKSNPQNLDYHEERCKLFEQIGDKKKALKGYIHMLKFLNPDQGEDGLKLAKIIAKIHFENGHIVLAQEAMETAFKKYPSFVTAEDTNLMLEVLMQRELFSKCIEVLVQYMKIDLLSENVPMKEFISRPIQVQICSASSFKIPSDLAIDLRVKFAIGFIRLQNYDIVEPIITELLNLSNDEYGDLYFEISEAYSKSRNYGRAIPILESLLESASYGVAAVWLLYGECLASCNRLEEAADSYEKVVQLAPQLGEPRLTFSSILHKLGRTSEAITALNQDDDSVPLDSQLFYQKCQILFEQERLDEFVDTAYLLFQRHFAVIRSYDEAETILNVKKVSNKFEALRDMRKARKEPIEDESAFYAGTDVPIDDQWELFKKVSEVLYQKKRFTELQRFTFSALGSKEIMKDKDRAKEVEFICLLSCIYNQSFYFAYNLVRDLIIKCPESSRCWNLLCYIVAGSEDSRHNRFLLRLGQKLPNCFPLTVLNGHNSLVSGTYNFSVAEYSHAFKKESRDPIIPLMLGLTYTHIACQKFSGSKNSLVLTATAFLNNYLQLRGECQEAFYNLGRALHQLNLLPQAIFYYKKALALQPVVSSYKRESSVDLDISKEIAFNLSLIYKKSGNLDLARMYINKYIRFD